MALAHSRRRFEAHLPLTERDPAGPNSSGKLGFSSENKLGSGTSLDLLEVALVLLNWLGPVIPFPVWLLLNISLKGRNCLNEKSSSSMKELHCLDLSFLDGTTNWLRWLL